MSFDLANLKTFAMDQPVARIVVAETSGSAPREAGASMVLCGSRMIGTIGGGALEHGAIKRARETFHLGRDRLDKLALGPSLGQCCGGAVTLVTEIWDQDRLCAISGSWVARPLPGRAARNRAPEPPADLSGPIVNENWLIEPVSRPGRSVWIFGAGHVGRAVASTVSSLPGTDVTLIDDAAERFPPGLPEDIQTLVVANPADAVTLAPPETTFLVMTYSHPMDLDICHRALSREFAVLGLIGSATKRARFRSRLKELGHRPQILDRMECPIGDPMLGKHPQAIALGVATNLLKRSMEPASLEHVE